MISNARVVDSGTIFNAVANIFVIDGRIPARRTFGMDFGYFDHFERPLLGVVVQGRDAVTCLTRMHLRNIL